MNSSVGSPFASLLALLAPMPVAGETVPAPSGIGFAEKLARELSQGTLTWLGEGAALDLSLSTVAAGAGTPSENGLDSTAVPIDPAGGADRGVPRATFLQANPHSTTVAWPEISSNPIAAAPLDGGPAFATRAQPAFGDLGSVLAFVSADGELSSTSTLEAGVSSATNAVTASESDQGALPFATKTSIPASTVVMETATETDRPALTSVVMTPTQVRSDGTPGSTLPPTASPLGAPAEVVAAEPPPVAVRGAAAPPDLAPGVGSGSMVTPTPAVPSLVSAEIATSNPGAQAPETVPMAGTRTDVVQPEPPADVPAAVDSNLTTAARSDSAAAEQPLAFGPWTSSHSGSERHEASSPISESPARWSADFLAARPAEADPILPSLRGVEFAVQQEGTAARTATGAVTAPVTDALVEWARRHAATRSWPARGVESTPPVPAVNGLAQADSSDVPTLQAMEMAAKAATAQTTAKDRSTGSTSTPQVPEAVAPSTNEPPSLTPSSPAAALAAPSQSANAAMPVGEPTLDLTAQVSRAIADLTLRAESARLVDGMREQTTTATLRLQPAHLGRVEIQVVQRADGRVDVRILAAQLGTRDALQSEVDDLVEKLAERRLEVGTVQVRSATSPGPTAESLGRVWREGRDAPGEHEPRGRERTNQERQEDASGRRRRRGSHGFDAEA